MAVLRVSEELRHKVMVHLNNYANQEWHDQHSWVNSLNNGLAIDAIFVLPFYHRILSSEVSVGSLVQMYCSFPKKIHSHGWD